MRSNEVITKMCLVYIRYIIYHLIQVTFMKLNVFVQGHVAEYVSHWGRHVRPIFTRDSEFFRLLYAIAKIAFITARIIASLDFISAVQV